MAGEPAWPSGAYQYSVVEQDLPVVLQEFGRNAGVRIEVSAAVHGRVRGPLPVLTPREFLDYLCANFGLEWYYDSFRLYVSAAKENTSQMVPRSGVPVERLQATMADLGLNDERFALRAVKQSDLLLVAGPPQYVAHVERTLAALKTATRPHAAEPSAVVVYRGDQTAVVKLAGDGSVP
ncbi:nodulation protein NolW [Bradyrhizobium sp. USDA 4353]